MKNIEDKLQQSKNTAINGIKQHVYDWVAAIIIVSLVAASLDVFGIISFNKLNFIEFVISWFPYFAAAILLHTDLYKKGVFIGKKTAKFKDVVGVYSEIANSLDGRQLKELYPFCETYNRNALVELQSTILKNEGIAFYEFDENFFEEVDGKRVHRHALKLLDKQQLLDLGYTTRQVNAITKARKAKVKGINVNILLSTMNIQDSTNIGDDQRTLEHKRITGSAIRYAASTLLLSIIAVKNILQGGLAGILLTLFKVAYLFAGCCMSYFHGYDDVTINLVNHFTRKTDILKMYLHESSIKQIAQS